VRKHSGPLNEGIGRHEMKPKTGCRTARLASARGVRAGIFLLLVFCIGGISIAQFLPPAPPPGYFNRLRETAEELARNQVLATFLPSLEAKENTDFLLTPALLMQEAISDQAIPTYPED
jgi:hypothetical protein